MFQLMLIYVEWWLKTVPMLKYLHYCGKTVKQIANNSNTRHCRPERFLLGVKEWLDHSTTTIVRPLGQQFLPESYERGYKCWEGRERQALQEVDQDEQRSGVDPLTALLVVACPLGSNWNNGKLARFIENNAKLCLAFIQRKDKLILLAKMA